MFDQIHKPRLLKDVPLILIRSMPSIYYYVNCNNGSAHAKASELFTANIKFLSDALNAVGDRLNNSKFLEISAGLLNVSRKSADGSKALNELTISLAAECSRCRDQVRTLLREIKSSLTDAYKNDVTPLKISIIKNDADPVSVEKLANILRNFCFYDVELHNWQDQDNIAALLASDFVIFGSVFSPEIHEQAASLQAYKRPGLAAAFLKKDVVQSLRHGAQLAKRGFPVLYKVFTPIRLFTSIDKVYILYHLGADKLN